MNDSPIYLDQAATGWPKDPSVLEAMTRQMQSNGVAAGRGNYRRGGLCTQVLQNVRMTATQLFHSPHDGHWILCQNGTTALNQAILGTLHRGDHVLTTQIEHNSVLRPLHHLESIGMIALEIVPCDSRGHVSPQELLQRIRPETRLLVVSHGSNVTGAIFPLQELCRSLEMLQHPRLLLLVDAAQTAGLTPISLREIPLDLLAMPGHKGLGGPLGTGLLYCGPKTSDAIAPILWGGTGSQSDQLEMPTTLPDRLEPGNQNVPAFAGLLQGLRLTLLRDLAEESQALRLRTVALCRQLEAIPGVRIDSAEQLPIISLRLEMLSVQDLAIILDSEFGIEVRAGLHCSPLIHKALGTLPEGTLRISFSAQTPDIHLDKLVQAIQEIASSA